MLIEGIQYLTNVCIACTNYKVQYSFFYLQGEVEQVLKLQYWMDYVSTLQCTGLFAHV